MSGHTHAHFDTYISYIVTDRTDVSVVIKLEILNFFRLQYIQLTLILSGRNTYYIFEHLQSNGEIISPVAFTRSALHSQWSCLCFCLDDSHNFDCSTLIALKEINRPLINYSAKYNANIINVKLSEFQKGRPFSKFFVPFF